MDKLIKAQRAVLTALLEKRATHERTLQEVRNAIAQRGEDATATDEETGALQAARSAIDGVDTEIGVARERLEQLEAEQRADEAAAQLRSQLAAVPDTARARVGQEERQYHRGNDSAGRQFLRDVGQAFLGDEGARQRLARHMQEERVERGEQLTRAAGTGAFAGLTVPQYLVDLAAPRAQAGRPFANAINRHELPAQGMTIEISRITSGTTVDGQANELDLVAESDMDDTILSIPVRTNAGSTTLSRQAVERSTGAEDLTVQDLLSTYATRLDYRLINDPTTGLLAYSTANGVAVTYTDATPTVEEFLPKLTDAGAQIEEALLNIARPDLAVMRPTRWGWINGWISDKHALVGQPGIAAQQLGTNFAERYGAGFRGVLPDDTAVVVDANIPGNLGEDDNQDVVFKVASDECHLWEDPNAPMFIRAEQSQVKRLAIDFVVYGYFAYTFGRYPKATAVIAGTGLVAPTF